MWQATNSLKNLLIIFGLLALVGFFAYSVVQYRKSGIEQSGVVACVNEECFWSAHIHVNVPIQICGQKYILPKFKGPLSGLHAHGDENIIHWHDKIAFNAKERKFLEPTSFALNLIFKTPELQIADDSLLNKKDGDLCRGAPSAWKVFVNETETSDWRNYEWKDRDIVLFIFDERGAEEIKEELRQNPLEFPSVAEE